VLLLPKDLGASSIFVSVIIVIVWVGWGECQYFAMALAETTGCASVWLGNLGVNMEQKQSGGGVIRLVRALGWSMAGLRAAFVGEAAFRQEVAVALVMTPLALWLGQTLVERALLLSSLLLVLLAELLNSAVEAVVDRVGSEQHPLSGRAKDIGSAAVFISLLNAAVVWGFLLWGRWN